MLITSPTPEFRSHLYTESEFSDMRRKLLDLEKKLLEWESRESWTHSKTRETFYHTIFDSMEKLD